MNLNNKGFSLVELLTTIVILTLIMGLGSFFVISFNNQSKEKAYLTTLGSIKNTSRDYILERGNTIGWLSENNDSIEEYICISLGALVDYGYFKNEIFNNYDNLNRNTFIKISRDKVTKSIISEEINDENNSINNFCKTNTVSIPTCIDNVVYNGDKQKIINGYDELKMASSDKDIYKINAGTYEYNFSILGDGKFVWDDGTLSNKSKKCPLKKANCKITKLNDKIKHYSDKNLEYNSSNDILFTGVNDKLITNFDSNNVVFNYYNYENKKVNNKISGQYDVEAVIDLPNYQCKTNTSNNVSNADYKIYYKINLDNKDATKNGTNTIYGVYKDNIYLDDLLTKSITTNANKVTIPERKGYSFLGYYYKKKDVETQLINKSGYLTSNFKKDLFKEDVTLYAKWTANIYKITLDNQSATKAGTKTVYYQYETKKQIDGVTCFYYTDEELNKCLSKGYNITKPTRTGYTFGGYYTKKNGEGTQYVNASGTFVNEIYKTVGDKTLYAKWTANTYKITLDNQSATKAGTKTVYYQYETKKQIDGVTCFYYTDEELNKCLSKGYNITKPTRTGYTFGGYYTEKSGKGTQYVNTSGTFVNEIYKTVGDKTLYAKWTANTYKVTFDANGGTGAPSSITVTYNSKYSNLPSEVPTREHCTFKYWYLIDANGNEIKITKDSKVTSTNNHTLYAKWQVNLKVGDYVNYTPSKDSSYNLEGKYTGLSSNVTIKNSSNDFKITSWRVLSINDNNIELIASNSTTGTVKFNGVQGYNNGVKLLNDACSSLYSDTSKNITARSIKIEDITNLFNSKGEEKLKNFIGDNETKYNTKLSYTYKDGKHKNTYYPIIYGMEKRSIINGVEKKEGLGPSEQDKFILKTDEGSTDGYLKATSLNPYQTYFSFYSTYTKSDKKWPYLKDRLIDNIYVDLFFPKGSTYWVATRSFGTASTGGDYNLTYVNDLNDGCGSYIGGYFFFDTKKNYDYKKSKYATKEHSKGLFPIVSLDISLIEFNSSNEFYVK